MTDRQTNYQVHGERRLLSPGREGARAGRFWGAVMGAVIGSMALSGAFTNVSTTAKIGTLSAAVSSTLTYGLGAYYTARVANVRHSQALSERGAASSAADRSGQTDRRATTGDGHLGSSGDRLPRGGPDAQHHGPR